MKFLVETGNESHTTSWQRHRALYASGPHDTKDLYQVKDTIVSQEWLENNRHQTVVKTVFNLPEGTRIHLNYASYEGKFSQIIRLDESADIQGLEVGVGRLRTYSVKGRFVVERDLIKEKEAALKASQEEDF